MQTASFARAYAQVSTQSGIASTDPHGLVLMLFDGAIDAIHRARLHLEAGRIGPRGEALSQAIQIVEMGLKASLDRAAGGELADSLGELYDYIGRRLLGVSLTGDASKLVEVADLLRSLRDAWAQIPLEARARGRR